MAEGYGEQSVSTCVSSLFRTHEVRRGTRVRLSIQVLLYACIMCHAFSHWKEWAGYINNARHRGDESVSQCFQSSLTPTPALFKSEFYSVYQLLRSQLSPLRFKFAWVQNTSLGHKTLKGFDGGEHSICSERARHRERERDRERERERTGGNVLARL